MISFNDFVHKYGLKNKATLNLKFYQVRSSMGLNNDSKNLRDGPFLSDKGIVKLHPSKETHWNAYINENYFNSYGCGPPKKLSKLIMKQN